MGMKRKKLYRFLAGLLCAGLLLADSSVGVFISTAAETRGLETDAEENVFTEDSGLNEGNGLADIDGIEGEDSLAEGSDAKGEENSTDDKDTDLGNGSTEEGDTDTENGSTEETDTDIENDAEEDVDTDTENESTEENGKDVENDYTEGDDTAAKNDAAEDLETDAENSSTEAAEEDDSEIVEQSDEADVQPDEDESIPRIEFKVSDIYYFDATIDVDISNCTDTNREFYILLQNTSDESEPRKIKMERFHEKWYFEDLEAGSTYKMWCEAEDVEQEPLIFNTTSLDELTMDLDLRPRMSGAYIRARFSKPIITEYDYGYYYYQYYPMLYYRAKGEKDWERLINYSNVNKLDDYTIEVYVHNSYTNGEVTNFNYDPETEFEYAFEFYYAKGDHTKSVLFLKDGKKVRGIRGDTSLLNNYELDTYTSTSLETAAGLITNTKWVDGAYTVTASDCDRTAYYRLVCNEIGSSSSVGMVIKHLGVDNWAEWNESEGGYTTQLIFEEGDLKKDIIYTYEFIVGNMKAYDEAIVIDSGIINTSGGIISSGSGNESSYEEAQRTSLEDMNPTISAIKAKTYDGSPYEPAVKVTVTENGKKKTLTQDIDYSVSYANNVNVGNGNVTIKGKGIYKGNLSKEFKINPKSIKKLKIVAGSLTQDITAADVSEGTVELPVCVYDGSRLLTKGEDYNLTFKKSTAKTVTLNVESIPGSNYTGTTTVSITIYNNSDPSKIINPSNVSFGTRWVYTGKALQPVVKVWIDGKNLDKKNYKVQYQNNKNAGTAYVIVTGKGAYKGKVVKSFEIIPKSTTLTIKNTITAKTYNGKLQKPSVTVTAGKTKLKKNKDYKVSYIQNLHAGTAVIMVTGTGNYKGSITAAFTIKPQKISKVSVKGTKTDGLTVTYGGRKLREGTDYTLDYGAETGNKVKVTITAKDGGDFTGGSVTKTVKIR